MRFPHFRGRINRITYFVANATVTVPYVILVNIVAWNLFRNSIQIQQLQSFFVVLLTIAEITVWVALFARRLHDLNLPTWVGFFIIIGAGVIAAQFKVDTQLPFVLVATSLVALLKGSSGRNEYGNQPMNFCIKIFRW